MKNRLQRGLPLLALPLLLLTLWAVGRTARPVGPEPCPGPPPSQSAGEGEQGEGPLGKGRFLNAGAAQDLSRGQREALLSYFDRYYEALARLSAPREEAGGIAAEEERARDDAALRYLVELRRMQRTDLSLVSYRYALTALSVKKAGENGAVEVLLSLDSVENFAAHPEVDSRTFGARHRFLLEEGEGGWRIRSHRRLDSLEELLAGEGEALPVAGEEEPRGEEESPENSLPPREGERWGEVLRLQIRREQLLSAARQYVAQRGEEPASPARSEPRNPEDGVLRPYDREGAVAYAGAWVGRRGEGWGVYDEYGGNCQNFVSQCLLAGGIPMDPGGETLWKWYGEQPTAAAGEYGRSASWSGVGAFRAYVQKNAGGFGLQAVAGAPYFEGRPGDVLEMGPRPGDLRHTVLITGLVRDGDGNTADYLVASNTADLADYPAGGCPYAYQELVRVLGWNQGTK